MRKARYLFVVAAFSCSVRPFSPSEMTLIFSPSTFRNRQPVEFQRGFNRIEDFFLRQWSRHFKPHQPPPVILGTHRFLIREFGIKLDQLVRRPGRPGGESWKNR